MREEKFLQGKAVIWTLPQINPGPQGQELSLKRILLPQGDLAQFYDSEEGIRYIASFELKAGTARGNHYHKIKREYVYMLSGEIRLVLQDSETQSKEIAELKPGDLVLIQPGIVHALQVKQSGMAVEFSPDRFDAADSYRVQLV